ncbi:MAG: mechanosensitive ion channel [Planctomycetota bacterium]
MTRHPLLALGLALCLGAGLARAQDQDHLPPGVELSPQAIQNEIAAIGTALPDATRAQALADFEAALASLNAAQDARDRAAGYLDLERNAPFQLAAIRSQLSRPPADVAPDEDVAIELPLLQIQKEFNAAEDALRAARVQYEDLQREPERRAARRADLNRAQAAARAELMRLQTELAGEPPVQRTDSAALARRLERVAHLREVRALIELHEAELSSYSARLELLPARRDLAQRRLSEATKRLEAWQDLLNEKRKREAEAEANAAREAAREAAKNFTQLKTFAQANTELASARADLADALVTAGTRLVKRRAELSRLRTQFHGIRRKLKVAGLTNAMGQVLRRQYLDLPDVSELRSQAAVEQDALAKAQFDLYEYEELRVDVGDLDAALGLVLFDAPVYPSDPHYPQIVGVARELVVARRDLLDALIREDTAYANTLLELNTVTQDLEAASEAYSTYIEERVLWVRSVVGPLHPDPQSTVDAALWFVSPQSWQRVLSTTWRHLTKDLGETGGKILIALLLGVLFVWGRRELNRVGNRDPRRVGFGMVLYASLLTVLVVLPVPGWCWLVANVLEATHQQPPLGFALASGLRAISVILLPVMWMWFLLRPKGLAEVHLFWPAAAVAAARRELTWLLPATLPFLFAIAVLERAGNTAHEESLGRLAFTAVMILTSVASARVFAKGGPVIRELRARNEDGWLFRLRRFWFPLLVGLPWILVFAAWAGYYYTAIMLSQRLQASLWLVLATILVHAYAMRWLDIARWKLVLEHRAAKRERERLEAERAAKEAAEREAAERAAQEAEERERAAKQAEAAEEAAAQEAENAGVVLARAQQPSEPEPEDEPDPTEAPSLAPVRPADPDDLPQVPHEEEDLDLPSWNEQTQQLFRSLVGLTIVCGLYWIWSSALPALVILDRVQIWPEAQFLPPPDDSEAYAALERRGIQAPEDTEEAPAAPGDAPVESEEGGGGPSPLPTPGGESSELDGIVSALQNRVTLADLGLGLLLVAVTILVSRNLPGLLEFLLLRRLPLNSAGRYATSTILRYLIVMIGMGMAFGAIGIGWSQVQWLAAALTFGLAFGLQEIFANFVSGLIILFEQPIRLGDAVTIGGVSGRVSRIRIRATTITDWDRKELIIPNKAIVTGEVINWSLSDTMLRIIIEVGVAYGSNTELARNLLLEIARKHPNVIDDPPPAAQFTAFGASTLDYQLKVFVPSPEYVWEVRHQLLTRIDEVYREHGIEIAFPQTDLHLRSIDGAVLERLGGAGEPKSPASN